MWGKRIPRIVFVVGFKGFYLLQPSLNDRQVPHKFCQILVKIVWGPLENFIFSNHRWRNRNSSDLIDRRADSLSKSCLNFAGEQSGRDELQGPGEKGERPYYNILLPITRRMQILITFLFKRFSRASLFN